MKAEWTNKDSLTSGETTKAILVIDQPKYCTECPLYSEDDYGFGCGYGTLENRRQTNVNDEIPAWCPLRPLPQYQQYRHSTGAFTRGFTKGWNTCIKEITGETE